MRHGQQVQQLHDFLLESRDDGLPLLRKRLGQLLQGLLLGSDLGLEGLDLAGQVAKAFEPGLELALHLEQLLDRMDVVFLLEAIEGVEPLLDGCGPLGVELHLLGLALQLAGDVFQLEPHAVEALVERRGARVVATDLPQGVEQLGELAQQRGVVLGERQEGGRQHPLDLFGMLEAAQLLFEAFLLTRFEAGLEQLVELELQQLLLLLAARLARLELVERAHLFEPLLVAPAEGVGLGLRAGQGVDHAQLERHLVHVERVELLVHVDQRLCQGAQHLQVDGRVVDEGARFAGRQQLAPDDARFFVIEIVGFEKLLQAVLADVEGGLDDALAVGIVQGLEVGPLAHDEAQGAQQDGLAGPRLARDNGQPFRKRNFQLLNEGVIGNLEVSYHSVRSTGQKAVRSGP